MRFKIKWVVVLLIVFVSQGLVSCSLFSHPAFEKNQEGRDDFYEPIRRKRETSSQSSADVDATNADANAGPLELSITPTPKLSFSDSGFTLNPGSSMPELNGDPITVSYNNLPIPAFINQVYGEQLGLSYSLSPQLKTQTDLVTLKINDLVSPVELYRIAKNTLSAYGININNQDGVLQFIVASSSSVTETPLLVSGRTLPEVPDSQRPVFMFVPLSIVSNNRVNGWLRQVLTGQDIKTFEDPVRNAIVLQGKPAVVEQGLAIIEALDKPHMRGKNSVAIEPVYMKPKKLADNLEDILKAEGFDASQSTSRGSVLLLPLDSSNTIIVFAPSQDTLTHVEAWAKKIDRKQQLNIESGIFTYEVKNSSAEHIVSILTQLSGASSSVSNNNSNQNQQGRNSSGSSRFVVDPNRNALVFQGSGKEWIELLPVIQEMDRHAPSVLVEVLVAEVTLNDSENSGVDWLANGSVGIDGSSFSSIFGTKGAVDLGSEGFNLALNRAGSTRAMLNLFYQNKRAEIRSRPRLMVKSGQEAVIEVGDEVPISTSSARSVENPEEPFVFVENFTYRKTGVELKIKPVVHASGYVDVEVDQVISSASASEAGKNGGNPTIFNRRISTTVTLRDGGSVLLGGLVSSTGSTTEKGMPVLGKLPFLGKLFRTDAETQDRTELMMLIIPYILNDPTDSESLLEELGVLNQATN